MTTWIVNGLILLVAFIMMEGVAWFAHKYIMHGLLWSLHRDHHQRENTGFFEKNDYFFLLFATPGIICIWLGYSDFSFPFWVGSGITLYGAAYFFIHDLFIHQRIKVLRNTQNAYFWAIRRAHKTHHKHLGKEDGECFGMLWAPVQFFRDAQHAQHHD